jgi:hypothetical protein
MYSELSLQSDFFHFAQSRGAFNSFDHRPPFLTSAPFDLVNGGCFRAYLQAKPQLRQDLIKEGTH